MRIIFILVILIFEPVVQAQHIIEKFELEGRIGNQPITMVLSIDWLENSVFGDYIYNKHKTPIAINGKINSNDLHITESIGDKITGEITAKFNDANGLVGNWKNSNKSIGFYSLRKTMSYKNIIESLSIIDNGINDNDNENMIIIEIVFKNGEKQDLNTTIIDDQTILFFEDLNFDGFPDLRILLNMGTQNGNYAYFLFDAKTHRFIYSEILSSNIINPSVLYADKEIIGFSQDGCCRYFVMVYKNNQFNEVYYDYDIKEGYRALVNNKNKRINKVKINQKEFEVILEKISTTPKGF